MKRRAFLVLCLVASPIAACSNAKEISAIAEQQRATVEPRLAQFRAVGAAAEKAPVLAAPEWKGPDKMFNFTEYDGNVEVMHVEDLLDTTKRGDVPLRVRDSAPANMTGHLLATGTWEGLDNPKVVKGFFEGVMWPKYVLAVKTLRYTPAKRTGDSTLDPGVYEGQALLYQLKDADYFGGFPVKFKSSDRVVLQIRNGPIRGMKLEEDFDKVMTTDMWAEFRRQLHGEVKKLLPKAIPPYEKDVAMIGEQRKP